jgi:hypothetical protein
LITGAKRDEVTGDGRKLLMISFIVCRTSPDINEDDQMEEKFMGRACGIYRGGKKYSQALGCKA